MALVDDIKKFALQNAIKFKGKANPGAVMGKLFALDANLRKQGKEVSAKVQEVLSEIHGMNVEEQTKLLQDLAPELLEKPKPKERDIFAFLNPKKSITTAFPPGPEKFPHIGHAKACLLNYMLAKEHEGTFLLRFEDTNPKTVAEQYYKAMLDGFKWLGVVPNEILYASDFMDMFYDKARELIKQGVAYVDDASQEEVKKSREKGQPTPARDLEVSEHMKRFEDMLTNTPEGDATVRLKIDLKHQNSTMRDPTIMRIILAPHARQGEKYRVWPNYDFQNAIMDSHSHIDMRLRSKEFEMRGELQRWIQDKLGMTQTNTYEFGRFNMRGVLSSGRIIREKVQSGELSGWDDPSLTTLVALRRRGFLPQAIKHFVISTGMSKAEATMTWDDLIMHNKRLLDTSAKRYSAIFDPIEVVVKDCPTLDVELHLDPNEKKGGRKHKVDGSFILSKADVEQTAPGELIRLMDCINIRKDGDGFVYDSTNFEDFKGQGKKVINWLPKEGNHEVSVLMPNKEIRKGLAEHNITSLKEGAIIQFERFGFCRLDAKQEGKVDFWYTHA